MQRSSNHQKKFKFVYGAPVIVFETQTPDLEDSLQIEKYCKSDLVKKTK